MTNTDIRYIEDNYVEFEEVLRLAGLSSDELNKLIEDKLIPSPSYVIESEITISSPLNDNHKIVVSKRYFAKNIIDLIRRNRSTTYEKLKEEFKRNLLFNLENHTYKAFAYGNVFDINDNIDNAKIDSVLEEEWSYFCKGVYGICTLQNNENAIINKEVAIKRILNFIENKSTSLTNEEKIELQELNKEFNKSTSLFAPYQRESSSRGKYLDRLLNEFDLKDLIKTYE